MENSRVGRKSSNKQTKIFSDDVFSVIGVYYTKKGVFLYLAFQMKCKYSVETYDLAKCNLFFP